MTKQRGNLLKICASAGGASAHGGLITFKRLVRHTGRMLNKPKTQQLSEFWSGTGRRMELKAKCIQLFVCLRVLHIIQ